MIESDKQDQIQKKIEEVQTFPVLFSLGEIKGGLTINTNTLSQPSKEQIISQAIQFHSQGNTQKAAQHYQFFINQGFKDHRVFSNYGVILKDLGKLKEAELYLRKAIELNPDLTHTYTSLGKVLKRLEEISS